MGAFALTNHALDRLSGLVFFCLGALVVLGAWRMPRFEAQASIYQAPGLTPGLLGLGLAVCGLILVFRGKRADADDRTYWDAVLGDVQNRRRAIAALALTLSYGGLLFGLIPYFAATFLFVFAFVTVFEIALPAAEPKATPRPYRSIAIAALLAAIVSFSTHYVFETLFLVQLP